MRFVAITSVIAMAGTAAAAVTAQQMVANIDAITELVDNRHHHLTFIRALLTLLLKSRLRPTTLLSPFQLRTSSVLLL